MDSYVGDNQQITVQVLTGQTTRWRHVPSKPNTEIRKLKLKPNDIELKFE